MTNSRMKLIMVLMCTAIIAVVVLQGSWLLNSYAVSKEKNEAEIKELLDLAITEQNRQAADTVRALMKQIIRSEKDFKYRIMEWPSGIKIGLTGKIQNSYALYNVSEQDTIMLVKDPYNFFVKRMNVLELDELYPLYATLVGVNHYPDNSRERALQLRLSTGFKPYVNTDSLQNILGKIFSKHGRSFSGSVRYFKDINETYQRSPKIKPVKPKVLHVTYKTIGVVTGSDNSQSLAARLELLQAYTDSLNRFGTATFVAKPLLNDLNELLSESVPTILVSVNTPYTIIAQKMSAGIFGSFMSMLFIMLLVIYMYKTILKQRQLSEIKNDFISNISHELKTPIATAQAAVQGLAYFDTRQNPEKTITYLKTASSEIQKLSLMVDKILDISLFESTAFKLSPEHFNFKLLLTQIAESQQIRKEKPINITLDYDADKEILADKTYLQNVMMNLIDNAIKYSGSKVSIDIKCRKMAGTIEIKVSDDGIGIPVKYQDHIFEKFFRVPTDSDYAVKGYGLGLNYVKTIVEKHHGSIMLIESGKQGSTFIIKLPQSA